MKNLLESAHRSAQPELIETSQTAFVVRGVTRSGHQYHNRLLNGTDLTYMERRGGPGLELPHHRYVGFTAFFVDVRKTGHLAFFFFFFPPGELESMRT